MSTRNRRGPSTVPCGTPHVTAARDESPPIKDHLLISIREKALDPG